MAKVYIVQESPGKNLLPARDFGEIQIMLLEHTHGWTFEQRIAELKKHIENFTERDYLILVGDPVMMGIATALVSEVSDGFFTVLVWDRVHYKYEPIQVIL